MIGSILGLFVVTGVIGILVSTRQVSRQADNLARMQESVRYAVEVLGRDLREAGGIACGSNLAVDNVLTGPTGSWWMNWADGNGIHGYEGNQTLAAKATGTAATERVDGTDAAVVLKGTGEAQAIVKDHTISSTPPAFAVDSAGGFAGGDLLMACDYSKAALLQVSSISGTSVRYNETKVPQTPGNTGAPQKLQSGGQLGKLSSNAWYIGHNGRGGTSLYRVELIRDGVNASTRTTEIAEGIGNLQIEYLTRDSAGNLASDYVEADSVTDWTNVVAARIALTMQTSEGVGTDGTPIEIEWKSVIGLRNRLP